MKKLKIFLLAFALLVSTSCELDLLDSPNAISPDLSNPEFILNSIQIAVPEFFEDASEFGMDNTRMIAMFGSTYPNAYQATTFDDMWSNAYSRLFSDVDAMLDKVDQNPDLAFHGGIAKTLKAYVLITLVDYFGDVPNSQALDPSILNPEADGGAAVYTNALELLDQAIVDFGNAVNIPDQDLYYGGDADKWITLAKTLKLKIYLQKRLIEAAASTTAINQLITDGDLIDTEDEDFVFEYPANSFDNPNNYHPWFMDNYQDFGANQYMSNSYINEMYQRNDPRLRYYFYRQTTETPTDVNVLDCIAQTAPGHYGPNDVFCSVGEGYFGRDHLDDDGIPPDTKVRTIYGLYPAGGKYDDDEGAPATVNDGARGRGFFPMITTSYVKFMLAESALILGTTGNPRTLLEDGMRASFDKVFSMADRDATANVPSAAAVNGYVNNVLGLYDGAGSNDERLGIIIREYWLALWGNGIEAYNTYRRTGHPTDLQPTLNAAPGPFYRSFTYPSVYVNRNSNATQKTSPAVKVFWDNNPDGFVD